jgi:hypothetical protein
VTADRRERILDMVESSTGAEQQGRRLCDVAAEVTEMTGAGIMLRSGETSRGSICSSNETSALLEELQFSLSEGPCVDACDLDSVVLEPDLAAPSVARWLAFAPPALAAGARAVFGFPLKVGTIRLGALNLYRDRAGALSGDQHADALVMSEVAAELVLTMQALAPDGHLAPGLEAGGSFANVVHQASGMVAVQLGVSVQIALLRLKAHAFGNNESLADIAREVVALRLRFTDQVDDA